LPKKIYVVELTEQERDYLKGVVSKGKAAAYRRRHGQILLKSDASPDEPSWTDRQIVEAFDVSRATVERVRARFVQEGLEAALGRKKQKNRKPRIIDGDAEAHLIALACSEPPEGRTRWTLKMLAGRLVELRLVETVSTETVRRTLKKTKSSPGWSSNGACREN
jgi:transposase